ncbi:MAG: ABC transporter ATP-binding protein, partial [Lentisphaerae bacterium]|nr:ABC transporter ATP-binding protein [Lentisphaerota bacterium]
FTLDVAFDVGNETMGLLGGSGSGKSMTLNCIAGIVQPDSGVIILDGKTLFDSKNRINLSPRLRQTGYLFQNYALFPTMTVEKNILSGIRHLPKSERMAVVERHIELFGLQGLEQRMPAQLSGGQQQRVALARMLASEPNILMLDEPFSALDQFLKERTLPSILKIIERTGKTALLVTHNMDEAYMFCPRIAVMSDGHIDTMGTRREVFQNPTTKAAARLTGVKNITAIEKVSENVFTSLDWGATLHCSQNLTAGHTYAGIRAHFLKIRRDSVENSIPCIVEQVLSTRFTKTVMLKPQNSSLGNIRIDADKELSERYIEIGENVFAEFPEDEIMLLR